MPEITIKFSGKEILLRDGIVTIGRATDNTVSFPGDSNISRFHAEIESTGGEHRLIDLGSSNGTTVNGKPVKGSVFLADGDEIVLGGSSRIAVEALKEAAADSTSALAGGGSGPNSTLR